MADKHISRTNRDDGATDSEKSAPHSRTTSPLLELSPELRHRIYEYVVTQEEPIDFLKLYRQARASTTGIQRHTDALYDARAVRATKQPALTRTCRAIRSDALPMFYGLNSFKGSLVWRSNPETAATWKWLCAIGKHRKHLQHFTGQWYEGAHCWSYEANLCRKVLSIVSAKGSLQKYAGGEDGSVVPIKFGDSGVAGTESLASK